MLISTKIEIFTVMNAREIIFEWIESRNTASLNSIIF
jgi:hypothetical protein